MEVLRSAIPPSSCCQAEPGPGLSQRWTGCPQSGGELLFPGVEFGTTTASFWAFAAETRYGLNCRLTAWPPCVQRNGTAP
jgi:hypothetical protein